MQIIKTRMINGLGKTKGCEKAPVEILKVLKKMGSSEDGDIFDYNKLNLEEIHVDLNKIKQANDLIFKNSNYSFNPSFSLE